MSRDKIYVLTDAQVQTVSSGGTFPLFQSTEKFYGYPQSYSHELRRNDIYRSPLWAEHKRTGIFVPPTSYRHNGDFRDTVRGHTIGLGPNSMIINSGVIGHVGNGVPVMSLTSLPSPYTQYNDAILKALEKLKDQDVNLANAIGEAGKTADSILDTAKRLAYAARQLKKGNLRGLCNTLSIDTRGVRNTKPPTGSGITSQWLQYQYGWKPLLGDIHGAVSSFHSKYSSPKKWRTSVRASSFDRSFDVISDNSGQFDYRESCRRSSKAVCGITVELKDNYDILKLSQLGVINPFSVAWELVPFSFMIDWFVPIGGTLNVLDVSAPYKFLGGYCTTVVKNDCVASCELKGVNGIYGWSTERRRSYQFERTAFYDFPYPRLYLKDPTKKNNAPTILANVLSIISQAFS